MTGFGKGESTVGDFTASVEIRSLNSRYLEVSVKLPQTLSAREVDVRELIRQRVGRGKLSVLVSTTNAHDENEIAVDAESVKRIMTLLKSLKKSARINTPIRLEHLLTFKELFKGAREETFDGDEWEAIKAAVEAAVRQLQETRTAEGLSLKSDLIKRIHRLNSMLDELEKLSRLHIEDEKTNIRRKMDEILNGKELDPARIDLEIVLLADKLDVTEEIVRFRTHNDFFLRLLEGEDSNGRRLNFLLQEMNREANTMGSKAFDAEMSHWVVEIKEELEKVREQVQNLE